MLSKYSVRKLVLALGMAGLAASAMGGELYDIALSRDKDLLRLWLESQAGTVKNAAFTENGKTLVLDLLGVSPQDASKRVASISRDHPLIKDIRVLPLNDGARKGARLLLDLRWQADVLDESIATIGAARSRWEIVLARHKPAAGVLQGVSELTLEAASDGPVLVLKGGADLQAGARYLANPARLVIDLPNIDPLDAQTLLAQFPSDHPQLKGAQVKPMRGEGSYLVFGLDKPMRLADTARQAIEGGTALRITLQDPAKQSMGVQLAGLTAEQSNGQLQINLTGMAGVTAVVREMSQPPRLVIRMQGVDVAHLGKLSREFKSEHPSILRSRMNQLGPRAVDLVFDLAEPLALLAQDRQPALAGALASLGLRLALPQPAQRQLTQAKPVEITPLPQQSTKPAAELDLSVPTVASVMRIKPLQLTDKQRQAAPLATSEAVSLSLLQAFEQALQNDAKYLAAKADFKAGQEALPQARAGYLPIAAFDYQYGRSALEVNSGPVSYQLGEQRYASRVASLTITQPLFKMPVKVKMAQAQVAIEQAKVALLAAEQDLMVRLSSGYLTLLAAQDGLELALAEQESTAKQYELARARLENGLGTPTQVYETEARFNLTQAREIDARNKLDDARGALKEILGVDVQSMAQFAGDFEASLPQPAQAEPWVAAALEQNLALQARQLSVEIAGLEVEKQKAGYMPTLNLVASGNSQHQGGSLYGRGSDTRNKELMLKFNAPLYEGGLTSSLVREAAARKEKVMAERDQEYRKTERLARSSMLSVLSSGQTLAALKKAMTAQESVLQAKQEGLKSGVQTVVTVLDAYRLYYASKRDYLQARYEHLLNRLRLKQAVGSLSRSDLEDIAQLLKN